MLELADHAIGRSWGGLTAKIRAFADGSGRPLVTMLTGGNVHDTTMFGPLLGALTVARPGPSRPRTRPDHLIADKGYSPRANRRLLRSRGIGHTIPEKAIRPLVASAGVGRWAPTRLQPRSLRPPQQHGAWLRPAQHWRGLATRYDKHARDHAGAITPAAFLTWLSRSARHVLAALTTRSDELSKRGLVREHTRQAAHDVRPDADAEASPRLDGRRRAPAIRLSPGGQP